MVGQKKLKEKVIDKNILMLLSLFFILFLSLSLFSLYPQLLKQLPKTFL